MPNYVYNRLNITGSPEELAKFKQHIDTPPAYIEKAAPEGQKHDGFSFHSFLTPPIDKYDEYMTTNGTGPNGPTGHTKFNWYNWNNEVWGTKWDAGDVEVWASNDGELIRSISINFQTAWSSPEPVYIAMAEQWPNLLIEIWWEEEQCYGAEQVLSGGTMTTTKVWDIPESHEDWENLGRVDECRCSWADTDEYFDDCPGKTYEEVNIHEYEVLITHKYVVTAPTAEIALRAVVAKENDFDMPEYGRVLSVKYDALRDAKVTKENIEEVNN
jgi:hypothetical protein